MTDTSNLEMHNSASVLPSAASSSTLLPENRQFNIEVSPVNFPPDQMRMIQNIDRLISELALEKEDLIKALAAESSHTATLKLGVIKLEQSIARICVEAANNDNGRAPHFAWRNYDDFNEYFWSLHCFEISWPWRKTSRFFMKPKPRSKI